MAIYYAAPAASGGSDANPGTLSLPFATINHAIGVMVGKDFLYLRAGTYAEALLNNNIPSGNILQSTTISAYQSEVVIIQPGSGQFILQITNGSRSFIDFLNIIFDGTGTTNSGIYFDSDGTGVPNHIRFFGGQMRHAGNQGFAIDGGTGGFWVHDIEIHNMEIHHNGTMNLMHGVYIQGNNCLIDTCDIHDNAGQGGQFFQQDQVPGSACNNNILRNSKIHNNNTAGGSRAAFTVDVGTGCQVYNNLFYGNPAEGLKVEFGADSTLVYNNTFYGNGKDAITVGFNTAYDGLGGFAGPNTGATNVLLKNNIVYLSTNGQSVRVFGSQNCAATFNLGDNGVSLGNMDSQSGTGSGNSQSSNLIGNPLLVNAAGNDFHIQTGSPAKNAGTSTAPTVTTDYDGLSRPQGSAYCIGAFEFALVIAGALLADPWNAPARETYWTVKAREILWNAAVREIAVDPKPREITWRPPARETQWNVKPR